MSQPSAPWCDTCGERIIWLNNHWQHVDTADHWKRISKDHAPTGDRWDKGEGK